MQRLGKKKGRADHFNLLEKKTARVDEKNRAARFLDASIQRPKFPLGRLSIGKAQHVGVCNLFPSGVKSAVGKKANPGFRNLKKNKT